MTVFYHTSEHDRGDRPRSVCTTVPLPEASSDTLLLARVATWAMRRTWRDGHRYSKAGIVTMDLVRLAASQRALPGVGQQDRERSTALMEALDKCNRRFGRGTEVTASAGMPVRQTWSTKFEMRSPRYTTRLGELPAIGAGAPSDGIPVHLRGRRTVARASDVEDGSRTVGALIEATRWRHSQGRCGAPATTIWSTGTTRDHRIAGATARRTQLRRFPVMLSCS